MSSLAAQDDPAFLRLVHELLRDSPQGKDGTNLRRSERRSYPCVQRIAPRIPGELPRPEDFQDVRCFDISPGGFSYLSFQSPEQPSLVVALGSPPQQIYMAAEVAHTTPLVLVGCRFTARLSQP